MRYNTEEEIEATGEWLMRVNAADVSEELLYVPSELSKLGVAPIDVVDRLDYLRESKGHPAKAHEEPEDEQEPDEGEEPEAPELVDRLEDITWTRVADPVSLDLDYDSHGAWEWAESIEKMFEDFVIGIFDLEPNLPEFNQLALEWRRRQPRARGKRARSTGSSIVPAKRAKKLVSLSSAGANE